MKYFNLALVIFLLTTFPGPWHACAGEYPGWRRGIVRVNSDISAGSRGMEEIAELAADAGLDFIVFSDQLIVRAEYGVPPFRNVLKLVSSRPSVMTFGAGKYIDNITSLESRFPGMVFIPGADIAAHYYWHGMPFTDDFECRRFSQQLTVFGPGDSEFYKNIPVIHNDSTVFSLNSLLKMLPLLVSLWGVVLLASKRKRYVYRDVQGNSFEYSRALAGKIVCCMMILIGILWTLDNRPFTAARQFSQYRDHGVMPYQQVIDYVRGEQPGSAIFWSAPEAEMRHKVEGVQMHTLPYLHEVEQTHGHNGFAGIYGDAYTAHVPGGAWDRMLHEYCSGARRVRPVIIGELDYHGSRRLDGIQTVVKVEEFNPGSVVEAIVAGSSYALARPRDVLLCISEASLVQGDSRGSLGETIAIDPENIMFLRISGSVRNFEGEPPPTDLAVIVNGNEACFKRFSQAEFEFEIPLMHDTRLENMGYVRFCLDSAGGARIISNPLFFSPSADSK